MSCVRVSTAHSSSALLSLSHSHCAHSQSAINSLFLTPGPGIASCLPYHWYHVEEVMLKTADMNDESHNNDNNNDNNKK